jgi:hypothetical protein
MSDTSPEEVQLHRFWFREFSQVDDDTEKVRDIFCQDRAALTVFAALLMTVNLGAFFALLPANFLESNSHNDEVQVLANFAFGLGSGSTLCVIFVGTWHYITTIKYGKDIKVAIHTIEICTPTLFQPVVQAFVSVWSTIVGVCALVYLFQGWKPLIAAAIPMVVVFTIAMTIGSNVMLKCEDAVYGKGSSSQGIKSFWGFGHPPAVTDALQRTASRSAAPAECGAEEVLVPSA